MQQFITYILDLSVFDTRKLTEKLLRKMLVKFTTVLLYFRLSPKIGPIHLAMHRCIQTLFTFFLTFMVITVAFAGKLAHLGLDID